MLYYVKRQFPVSFGPGKRNLKWFPRVVSNASVVKTVRVAKEVAALSGASVGDVLGILYDLGSVMKGHLGDGKRVKLDGIGEFKLLATSRGNGVDKEEDVSAKQFNHVRVCFSPERSQSHALGAKEFSLIPSDLRFEPYVDKQKVDAAPEGGNDNAEPTDPDQGETPDEGGDPEQGGGGL